MITPAFYDFNIIYKVGYTLIAFFTKRLQFYVAFRGQELGCVSAGLGYNGIKDGVHQWDRAIGGVIMKLEKSCNPVDFMKDWNLSVSEFMRYYIFKRQLTKGQKP
jgi:lysophospholipid acyltransferase